jgi:ribosomal protein S18 acetylase RimI-like enzyme
MYPFTITKATETDIESYQYVAQQSFIDAFEEKSNPENFKKYISTAFTIEELMPDLQNNEHAAVFFIHSENTTIGYVKLRWDRSEEYFGTTKALELQRIYLLKEYWNKGYGRHLLDFSEKIGLEQGFEWIWLCVWCENHGAIRFYEREGWEKFAYKNFQFGDEIHVDPVLKKQLFIHPSQHQFVLQTK